MSQVTAEQAAEQIGRVYAIWAKAIGGEVKDPTFFDRHVDDGWWCVEYRGARRRKDEYRKFISSIASYRQEMQQLDARMVSEDLALVTGVYRANAELVTGEKLINSIIFTALWQLRDGVWVTLMHHTTRLPD